MHAGEAIWNLYGLVTALERAAGNNMELMTLLAGARNDLKTIGDFVSVPAPSDAELAPRIPKLAMIAAPSAAGASNAVPSAAPGRMVTSGEVRDALALCDLILGDIDEMPEEAEEFAGSVSAKVKSMRASIEQRNSCTPRMYEALQNMRHGQEKWMHHE